MDMKILWQDIEGEKTKRSIQPIVGFIGGVIIVAFLTLSLNFVTNVSIGPENILGFVLFLLLGGIIGLVLTIGGIGAHTLLKKPLRISPGGIIVSTDSLVLPSFVGEKLIKWGEIKSISILEKIMLLKPKAKKLIIETKKKKTVGLKIFGMSKFEETLFDEDAFRAQLSKLGYSKLLKE